MINIDSSELNKFSVYLKTKSSEDEKKIHKVLKNSAMEIQKEAIINLTNNKCEIKPNLYIDTSDVEASHSALIGKFSDEEMFYIQSRGIDYETALKLLITGFLTSDINNKKIIENINKNINKYWR